jgi:hypothetical protein
MTVSRQDEEFITYDVQWQLYYFNLVVCWPHHFLDVAAVLCTVAWFSPVLCVWWCMPSRAAGMIACQAADDSCHSCLVQLQSGSLHRTPSSQQNLSLHYAHVASMFMYMYLPPTYTQYIITRLLQASVCRVSAIQSVGLCLLDDAINRLAAP